jgi:hypothetical protein
LNQPPKGSRPDAGSVKTSQAERAGPTEAKDSRALPLAGPIGKGENAVWRQRSLWGEEDYRFNIQNRVAGLYDDYATIRGLAEECY